MFKLLHKDWKIFKQEIVVLFVFLLSALLLIFVNINFTGQRRILETNNSISIKNNDTIKRLPSAIIIGSRKSGTRALLKFLELNPAIKSAKREIHFFDRSQNYKQGLDWYINQMPFSNNGDVTIEKSPAYFVTKGVAEKVKEMNASIKLILILRDPVTRLISDYSQLVANKIHSIVAEEEPLNDGDYYAFDLVPEFHSNLSIEAIWNKAEKSFESYVRRSDGGIDDQRRAVRIGMYSNYLEKWRSIFPIKQFHFVNGELLISEPDKELNKLENFLGFKPVIRGTDFVFNERKGFFCLKQNKDSTKIMPNNQSSNCLSRSKGRRHVVVKSDLIRELRTFYAPYNEYLYSLTGQNFSWPI